MTVTNRQMANAIRALAMDAVEKANSGHPGLPMGMADVATVLWRDYLSLLPAHPHWPNRDRFVLSAGHGSLLLYALGYLTGYNGLTIDDLKNFRQLHSKTPGHPERDVGHGVETTTGPLGQGFANAVGMALAERMLNARFGDQLVDHYTYVIASDGDLQEGISHEAAALAGHLKLSRLIVLYDDNQITIDGPTSLSSSEDTAKRFDAYGWATRAIDGHDEMQIRSALDWAKAQNEKPVLILCRTTIGFGAPNKGGTAAVHGSPLGADEIRAARAALDWPHEPFVIPPEIKAAWENVFPYSRTRYQQWQSTLLQLPDHERESFMLLQKGSLCPGTVKAFADLKDKFFVEKPTLATRAASGRVLEAIQPHQPNLVGGSADLTPSNNTHTKTMRDVTPADYSGHYIRWGIREHAMAAAMNGMALHGGLIPYGGTFLTFSDYCRPALRLAALMQLRAVFVMTHDSIGVGEDGPTHQPVEHLAALRAIPGLSVIRPADAVETLEAWECALTGQGPTLLALSRQNLPALRQRIPHHDSNMVARGGYVLRETAGATITLIASGSEVSLAVAVADLLESKGQKARIVSMPSLSIFMMQPQAYQEDILQPQTMPVVIEAGVRMCWDRLLGNNGLFFGVEEFGMSAPAAAVYDFFGLTPEKIVTKIQKFIG